MGQIMTAIRTEQDRKLALEAITRRKLPFSCTLAAVSSLRSSEQNRLQRKWLSEAQEQGDQTAEEYRGYCKLHFGVAIMKYESPDWAEKYDAIIKPLDYPQKIMMMMEPLDFPVTRCMSTKGKTQYLDKMKSHLEDLGFLLTQPNQPPDVPQ